MREFIEAKNSHDYASCIEHKIKFLKEVNDFLYQPLPKDDWHKAKEEILKIHEDRYNQYFSQCSPIVLSALYCLYGNDTCRKILKPKKCVCKTNYYNAVMDFQHFSFFALLASHFHDKYNKKYCAKLDCEFLSGDKSLTEFFSWFDVRQFGSSLSTDELRIDLRLSRKGIKSMPCELRASIRKLCDY